MNDAFLLNKLIAISKTTDLIWKYISFVKKNVSIQINKKKKDWLLYNGDSRLFNFPFPRKLYLLNTILNSEKNLRDNMKFHCKNRGSSSLIFSGFFFAFYKQLYFHVSQWNGVYEREIIHLTGASLSVKHMSR